MKRVVCRCTPNPYWAEIIDLMDITCTEKIHEMKMNQLWVFHVQNDRESPYISTYVAMSYFIGMANRREREFLKGKEREREKLKLRRVTMGKGQFRIK